MLYNRQSTFLSLCNILAYMRKKQQKYFIPMYVEELSSLKRKLGMNYRKFLQLKQRACLQAHDMVSYLVLSGLLLPLVVELLFMYLSTSPFTTFITSL